MNAPPPPQDAPSAPGDNTSAPAGQAPASSAPNAEVAQPQPQPQPQAARSAATPGGTPVAKNGTSIPNPSVRSASATLEKVERAMDELRAQPASATTAPAAHAGRGGRRGGRGGAAQSGSSRVQVPDTEFDFEAMNAKFDKASLRPGESESDSASEASDENTPNETDKKEKTGKFYNPQRSFFDDISSDSNLKNEGPANPRGIYAHLAYITPLIHSCRSRSWSRGSFGETAPRRGAEPQP